MNEKPPPLELSEALKDSPRFRFSLRQHDQYLSDLERKLQEVVRQCSIMVDFGKSYVAAFANMMITVQDLNMFCFGPGTENHSNFSHVTHAYADIINYHRVLVEQAHWSIVKNLTDFVQREIHKVRNVRAQFEKVSHSLDEALVRNAQVSRQKEQETAEVRNELTAVGTCFAHTALDYVYQMNLMISQKDPEIIEAFVSFLRACRTFFHQGEDAFKDWGTHEEIVSKTVINLKDIAKVTDRKMLDRHLLVPKEIFQHPTGMSPEPDVVMEGYLFKRATNAFKTWHRRWFLIRDHKLMYCHRDAEQGITEKNQNLNRVTDDGYTIMESDLRLCLVRSAPINFERMSCFELVTPTKSHMLQADSPSICAAWIKALKRSIEDALHDHDNHTLDSDRRTDDESSYKDISTTQSQSSVEITRSPSKTNKVVEQIMSCVGNDSCADCGQAKPMWASINLGVSLCIECCGIHRSLGVQISKVRSLTLDDWEQEHIQLMVRMGNNKVNEIMLANWTSLSVPPPAKHNSNRSVRDAWIRAKYVEHAFCRPQISTVVNHIVARKKLQPAKIPAILKAAVKGRSKIDKDCRSNRATSVVDSIGWEKGMGSLDSAHSSRSTPDLNSSIDNHTDLTISRVVYNDLFSDYNRLSSAGSDTTLNSSELNNNPSDDISFDKSVPVPNIEKLNICLAKAAGEAHLLNMCKNIARGADIDATTLIEGVKTTPLHMALCSPYPDVTVEYLLLNGAKCNGLNYRSNTPLHLAVEKGLTGCVCLLIKRGAERECANAEGETPLDIAVNTAHADIVTLLRVCKLREGDENAEYLSAIDDTVAGVFSDISRSLARNSQLNIHGNGNANANEKIQ